MSSRSSMGIITVGFMLFALFFGAGNLIFPAQIGQAAGDHLFTANLGFIITGVGLPVLGVLALAISVKNDLQTLASQVHPLYGIIFTVALYLTIGPLFALPRTNTVAYEIGISPFFENQSNDLVLLIFTVIFFSLSLFMALQSSKIVDIIGKVLTPLLLIVIALLIIAAFINPIGAIQEPTEAYTVNSFFKGFQEGYLTMDMLAAFVFGIIIINAVKDLGYHSKKQMMRSTMKAALIAAVLLAIVYSSLAYVGAISVNEIGYVDNGGTILAASSEFYFGSFGKIILGFIVIGACLTTSIGLITSCASYFHKIIPKLSYQLWAVVFTVISAVISNFGLTTIIEFSVPVLSMLYPLAMCLLVLTLLHPLFKGKKEVYQISILFTFVIALVDGLKAAGINIKAVDELFTSVLPLYAVGLGWMIPAIAGGLIGFVWSRFRKDTVA
ncbi:branched-chain amino acid transport system II carrier protein [Gracilibacillus caseinilyticus]|uniref:Branched-chain amino acid transport system carrier protein n=1 Tax=Gracilibacillus caseinilyticus TaxID=2932256 RepID=A0ABY4EXV5_9BACI|nr:branched-chain amino acid transport system II carrier protein [Gracilibacillus caseinilyticus]UOQ48678.1 branched-chain amino acid transport system II carrier protein [Gracilibacillus caseinilyticus]